MSLFARVGNVTVAASKKGVKVMLPKKKGGSKKKGR